MRWLVKVMLIFVLFFYQNTFADTVPMDTGATRPQTYSTRLARRLSTYEHNRNDKAAIRSAKDLKAEGDAFYLKGDFYKALRKYDDSAIYFPSPETLFMSGDAEMRLRLQFIEKASLYTPGNKCWPAYAFAYEVSTLVFQDYFELGFDIADKLNLADTKAGGVYKRTASTAICLQSLISEYASRSHYNWSDSGQLRSPQACVDAEKIKACMGKPLISK